MITQNCWVWRVLDAYKDVLYFFVVLCSATYNYTLWNCTGEVWKWKHGAKIALRHGGRDGTYGETCASALCLCHRNSFCCNKLSWAGGAGCRSCIRFARRSWATDSGVTWMAEEHARQWQTEGSSLFLSISWGCLTWHFCFVYAFPI